MAIIFTKYPGLPHTGRFLYDIFYAKKKPPFMNFIVPDEQNTVDLDSDYAEVGTITADDEDDAYYLMQGEVWSPQGEARTLIAGLGLKHTSMSVGDVLYNRATMKYTIVVSGFREVTAIHKPTLMEQMDASVEGQSIPNDPCNPES
jgi:hypothetical protein